MNPKSWLTPAILIFTTAYAIPAWATPPTQSSSRDAAPADDISAPPRGSASAAKEDQPTSAGDHVLWDHWYTVTIKSGSKPIHYEYYSDHAELKKNRVIFQNHAWKMEEGYLNEEQIGAFAENNSELTPLFFNFHSNYRSTEISIDGNVKEGKELTVRIRQGAVEQPLLKRQVPHKTFFSELFPIWLGKHLPSFKKGQLYGFQTILEDNVEAGFAPTHGSLRVEAPDDFANRSHTIKLAIEYRNLKSIWWVEPNGASVRIELPLQNTVVERVSKETAQSFLEKK